MQVVHNGWIYSITNIDYTAGSAAVLYAAPEDCHPEEESEIDYDVPFIENDSGDIDDIVSGEELDLLVLMQYEEESE